MLATRYPTLDSGVRQVEARMARALRPGLRFPYLGARALLSRTGARQPARVLLAAAGLTGSATEDGLCLAAAAEFVHTALHAHTGVGLAGEAALSSARSRWEGPRQAVMLGDYLMALAFKLLPEKGGVDWAAALATVVRDLAAAHLLEARGGDRKVLCVKAGGSLLAFCGRAGVVTSGGSDELAGRLAALAEQLGAAHYLLGRAEAGGDPLLVPTVAERRLAQTLLTSARRVAETLPPGEGRNWLAARTEVSPAAALPLPLAQAAAVSGSRSDEPLPSEVRRAYAVGADCP